MKRSALAAIVPAYNEEKNIGRVLAALKQSDILSEIIVVDDGSRDRTAEVAERMGVRVIRQENQGKGAAMCAGALATNAPIIFFCDADLLGLTSSHISALVQPIVRGSAGMTVGIRDRGTVAMWLMRTLLPLIGGERVLRRELFMEICTQRVRDFGIESAMNAYCRKKCISVGLISLVGVTHLLKEQKYGLSTGFCARLKLIWQVIKAEIWFRFRT